MDAKVNSLNWFEISVADISRAKKFYETIFGINLESVEMMGMKMAMFPSEPGSGKANGGLCESDMHKPSADGVKIYLNGDPDLSDALGKVESAGGKITMPKTDIGEDFGHMAFFIDTEGNVIGLHSNG
ncbi:MAG: VOC family protein [Fimbriimonadaceae bacterium]|nr:VOC family protein [Chitinophagales bacterium]